MEMKSVPEKQERSRFQGKSIRLAPSWNLERLWSFGTPLTNKKAASEHSNYR
jgi:hypothetical protein